MSVPRGIEPFRDTLDVRLDSRQVFLLFFGGAISACLVFALGVMVGRRLEAKTARSDARVVAPSQVPLAQLDQIADEEDELSFHQQLSSGKGGGAGDALANGPKLAPRPAAPVAVAKPAAAAQVVAKPDKKKTEKPGTGDGQQATGNALKKPDVAPVKKPDVVADKSVKKPDVAKPDAAKPEVAKPDAATMKAAKAEAAAAAKAAKADAAEGKKFALTLPTFTDKAEADALCAKLSSNGYSYHVASVTTPDASVVYRVRVGEFATRADALTAKTEFEKKQHVIAYVTKLP